MEGRGIVIEGELQTKMESCDIDTIHQVNRGRRWEAVEVTMCAQFLVVIGDPRFFILFV